MLDIEATSYTCAPFSATFDVPEITLTCNRVTIGTPVSCGTRTIAAHTITVYE